MTKRNYHDPNNAKYLDRRQASAERKLREIELRRNIARVTHQIALLENMKTIYPKQENTE